MKKTVSKNIFLFLGISIVLVSCGLIKKKEKKIILSRTPSSTLNYKNKIKVDVEFVGVSPLYTARLFTTLFGGKLRTGSMNIMSNGHVMMAQTYEVTNSKIGKVIVYPKYEKEGNGFSFNNIPATKFKTSYLDNKGIKRLQKILNKLRRKGALGFEIDKGLKIELVSYYNGLITKNVFPSDFDILTKVNQVHKFITLEK